MSLYALLRLNDGLEVVEDGFIPAPRASIGYKRIVEPEIAAIFTFSVKVEGYRGPKSQEIPGLMRLNNREQN